MASLTSGQSEYRLLWEAELTIVGKPTWRLSTPPLASWLASWSGSLQKVVKKMSESCHYKLIKTLFMWQQFDAQHCNGNLRKNIKKDVTFNLVQLSLNRQCHLTRVSISFWQLCDIFSTTFHCFLSNWLTKIRELCEEDLSSAICWLSYNWQLRFSQPWLARSKEKPSESRRKDVKKVKGGRGGWRWCVCVCVCVCVVGGDTNVFRMLPGQSQQMETTHGSSKGRASKLLLEEYNNLTTACCGVQQTKV